MVGAAKSRWRRAAVGGALAGVLTVALPGVALADPAHPVGATRWPHWVADEGPEPVQEIDTVVQIDTVLTIRVVAAVAQTPAEALKVLLVRVSLQDAGAAGIPVSVLSAYRQAEANLGTSMPACHLPWWLLAGIGRIESGHAGGGRVDDAGTTRGRILGPVLDGSMPGTAIVRDTDGGAMDGDPGYDRAVGPMQFLPGTWKAYARDGNGDGIVNPHNIFDAATTAGVYLCRNGGDLATPDGIARAVLAYNHSDSYLRSVLTWGAAYRDNVTPAADQAGSIPTGTTGRQPETPAPVTPAPAPPPASATSPTPTTSPTSEPSPTPTSTPSPSSDPTPTSTPSPTSEPTPTTTPTPSVSPSTTSTTTSPGPTSSTTTQ
ncbi:MAG: lytic murein transglycosylase [Dermatophilaceae bacterium]